MKSKAIPSGPDPAFSFRKRISCQVPFLFLVFTLFLGGSINASGSEKLNVLFIAVDDLRPQLQCYGRFQMKTPNMDRLANGGLLFERAYCMVPVCGASRASLMTGIRPTRERFQNYRTWAEKDAPGIPALNDHFKKHGFKTISLGKVYHHKRDHEAGWDVNWRPGDFHGYQTEQNRKLSREGRGFPYERAEAPDKNYPDGKIAQEAIRHLQELGDCYEITVTNLALVGEEILYNSIRRESSPS